MSWQDLGERSRAQGRKSDWDPVYLSVETGKKNWENCVRNFGGFKEARKRRKK